MRKRYLLSLLLAGALLAGVAAAAIVLRAHSGLAKAEVLARNQLWAGARQQLERYLWLNPRDGQARLLMAEALVRDPNLSGLESAPRAIAHLEQVPDASPSATQARIQQARQHMLVLHQPAAAERALTQAIQLEPSSFEAHYLLWKIRLLTGRAHLTRPLFWQLYERAPREAQAALLREWYLSQFYPQLANAEWNQQLGFQQPDSEEIEPARYMRFRQTEPGELLGHVAMARWFLYEGHPQQGLKLLRSVAPDFDYEMHDPFYVATLFTILIQMGEFDQAQKVFEEWPQPHEGYEYWLAEGTLLDEVQQEFEQALVHYRQALSEWPGPVDWRTRHRIAGCLARLGRADEAAAVRAEAQAVEELMQAKAHQPVREALNQLDNPDKLSDIVAFYQRLDCEREVRSWQLQIERLRSGSPAATKS